jgi:hypothetical protein
VLQIRGDVREWKFDPAKKCATASLSVPVSCRLPTRSRTLTKILFDHLQSMVPDSEF